MATWIERRAAATPGDLMTADDRGRHQTFGEYAAAVRGVAAALAAEGVGPGSVVAWQLPTWIEAFVLAGALGVLDATQVPLLPIYREREIAHAVRTTGASLVVVPRSFGALDLAAQAQRAVDELTADGRIPDRRSAPRVLVVGERSLPTAPAAGPAALPEVSVDGDPVRWVFHTSGTTAEPKGVRHTDATMLAAARAFAHSIRITSADRNAVPFPVTHIGGIQLLIASLEFGCVNILIDRFVAADAVPLLAREGVTLAGAGPAFFHGYLEEQARQPDVPIFPRVRAFTSGGAPKSPALHAALVAAFGVGTVSNYGLTECPNTTGNDPDSPDDVLAHTEGRANPGVELSVRAPDGTAVPPGTEGELWIRGPQLFRGYVDASLDADAFDPDGYFRTGDLVRVDAAGNLHVVGRIKDVIIRKGENISAKEVEDALAAHPAVREVAVVGLPDARSGERACAVVVPTEAGSPPTLAELTGFLRDGGLMVQKWPEQLEIVESLPRNAIGKVVKADLRARFAG
jgi:acyl-CoA synthetase (AMP-forming)/AMP-acid ligase II